MVRVSVTSRPTVEQVAVCVGLTVAAVGRDAVDDGTRQRYVQVEELHLPTETQTCNATLVELSQAVNFHPC